ncbi:MAG: hypothetical protein HY916_10630 [Desulfovibrio sp.]|jgi:hypothetical protein|nr:hypothetical protein [Desulfovibrio sp.]
MSRLHSRLVPWILLGCFLAGAFSLFFLAAGSEALQLRGVMTLSALWAERPAPGEVRRMVTRLRERGAEAEQRFLESAAETLSRGGQRLEERAERVGGGKAGQPEAAPAGDTSTDAPIRLKSHRFRDTDTQFKGMFFTDRAPVDGKTYFLRNPSRWVVELPGRWRNSSHRLNELPGTFINRVVVEADQGALRVTFHYADPAAEGHERVRLELEAEGFSVTIPKPKEPASKGRKAPEERRAREQQTL